MISQKIKEGQGSVLDGVYYVVMKRYIVLLRGVMPFGKNKVPMATLREILTKAGFKTVRTYIQSGNALVDTDLSAREVAEKVHTLIKTHIGADLVVVVRTGKELETILANNPFQKGYDSKRVFFVSFAAKPSQEKLHEFLDQDFGEEKIELRGNTAYIYVPSAFTKSKLENNKLEKKLQVSATTRNFNTISKLIALAKE
jgi:uncharacterized protein (DUF1697 family)